MRRRTFLAALGAGACTAGLPSFARRPHPTYGDELAPLPPAFSVIPVVGDGRWIWTSPPKDQTGYLEPRAFRLSVGIELTGRGNAAEVTATTPVPIECPEQTIDSARIEKEGLCDGAFAELAPSARQLIAYAPQLVAGQRASVVAHYELTLSKQYFGYRREQFDAKQAVPADVRTAYLGDSPGIQTRTPQVRGLLKQLGGREQAAGQGSSASPHPWDLAERCAAWIREHIRPRLGSYTGVTRALDERFGDCEEMAGVFTAVMRAAGVPSRLVWIPNHVWSELYLVDAGGEGRWIPVHTACYHWFGWTGAHELVLQKGDRLKVPGKATLVRLQQDRLRWTGIRPEVAYWAELTPQPPREVAGDGSGDGSAANEGNADAGPGARRKIETGEWRLIGTHPLDRNARQ